MSRGRLPIPAIQRFRAKYVVDAFGCWLWTGAKNKAGYSQFEGAAGTTRGHKFAHEYFIGPIPDGLEIDHTCRNRGCVNPAHLELVTHDENLRRRRWVAPTCRNGHPRGADTFFVITRRSASSGSSWKRCRKCHAEAAARYGLRTKQRRMRP